MAKAMTSIRLDTQLADEAAKILGVRSRTEAVHVALQEIVALKKFKNLMTKHAGKLTSLSLIHPFLSTTCAPAVTRNGLNP
jgi:Arc/MetJ family transcription regulator